MLIADCVKPETNDSLEDWHRWINRMSAEFVSGHGKKINVIYVNESVCTNNGMKKTNPDCIALGECSWFRHSQDSMSSIGNLPPGFVENE